MIFSKSVDIGAEYLQSTLIGAIGKVCAYTELVSVNRISIFFIVPMSRVIEVEVYTIAKYRKLDIYTSVVAMHSPIERK
jgi:hypothetical protein